MSTESKVLLKLYETMVRIRVFEQRAEQLFLDKKIPGFIHLYIGEEAIAAGVITQLRDDDYLTSTHRGHGHMLAKGADSKRMMAELFGKEAGYCKGKGGSMHIMNFALGVLGANGEVAGGIPIAAGAGMAIRFIKKTDQVVACFFGDGASNRGAFHEGLNWAAVYQLPIVFVEVHHRDDPDGGWRDYLPGPLARIILEQCGLNKNPWGRPSGADQASPVHRDTAPILADGYPVRTPPLIPPLPARMTAGQVSPDSSRILRE